MTIIYQHFIVKSHMFKIKQIFMAMLITLSASYVDASAPAPDTVTNSAISNRATFNSVTLDTIPVITMHDLISGCQLDKGYSLPDGVTLDYSCNNNEALLTVTKAGKYGFVNHQGEIVVPIIYDQAYSFYQNDLARVQLAGKYGFVNKQGKLVIPTIYDYADSFSDGFARVTQQGKVGYIDQQNKVVIPFDYEAGWHFNKGFVTVKKEDKYGVINQQNKVITPFEYDSISIFSDQQDGQVYFELIKQDKHGVANQRGQIIIPLQFDKLWFFSEGLINVKQYDSNREGKWGYYNKQGKVEIDFIYDSASGFADGWAKVGIDDDSGHIKYGFINRQGEVVLPIEYDSIYGDYFTHQAIGVQKDDKSYLINRQGQKISADYYELGEFNGNLVIAYHPNFVEGKQRFALLNEQGKEVIPLQDGYIMPIDGGNYVGHFLIFLEDKPPQMVDNQGKLVAIVPDFKLTMSP
ncbi:WG repeat-containing protein [Psychrobacter sp. I-STPA10]|uniref:WG repeat-containing protein n=1 Tax=Psychrobacter sp. I-STPA10 TaxID=2585769 RepID=UPI001E5D0256|nr:WG repeat-containing protein [Psychrobacter sp. I-STPA10]